MTNESIVDTTNETENTEEVLYEENISENETGQNETQEILTNFSFSELSLDENLSFEALWAENGSLVQYIDDCGTLNTTNGVYALTNNVNSTGTCFNISANNVTLDCQGYTINYSSDGSVAGYG